MNWISSGGDKLLSFIRYINIIHAFFVQYMVLQYNKNDSMAVWQYFSTVLIWYLTTTNIKSTAFSNNSPSDRQHWVEVIPYFSSWVCRDKLGQTHSKIVLDPIQNLLARNLWGLPLMGHTPCPEREGSVLRILHWRRKVLKISLRLGNISHLKSQFCWVELDWNQILRQCSTLC